jgi:hypothetical protein
MDMSTPLSGDDHIQVQDTNPEIANSILDKFNNMSINMEGASSGGYEGDLPPLNPQIPLMEHDMENRNTNAQLENMRYMNPIAHIEAQKAAAAAAQQQYEHDQDEDQYEDDMYEDIIEKTPLWKKILNELRIVLFVMIMTLFLFNNHFNKFVTQYVPLFRLNNYTYDTNIFGTIVKALVVGILSYGLIRSVKF